MKEPIHFHIFEAQFNTLHTHLVSVKAVSSENFGAVEGIVFTRKNLVERLEQGTKFSTARFTNGRWMAICQIRTVLVNGMVFLKADNNQRELDSLQEDCLPKWNAPTLWTSDGGEISYQR